MWSTVSVLKADAPASYPGKHQHIPLPTALQSPYMSLIGSAPSREGSFSRCALPRSRTASPHCTFTGPRPTPCTCTTLWWIRVPRHYFPLYSLNSQGIHQLLQSLQHRTVKPRFLLNHILLNEDRLLSSFQDTFRCFQPIPSTVSPGYSST